MSANVSELLQKNVYCLLHVDHEYQWGLTSGERDDDAPPNFSRTSFEAPGTSTTPPTLPATLETSSGTMGDEEISYNLNNHNDRISELEFSHTSFKRFVGKQKEEDGRMGVPIKPLADRCDDHEKKIKEVASNSDKHYRRLNELASTIQDLQDEAKKPKVSQAMFGTLTTDFHQLETVVQGLNAKVRALERNEARAVTDLSNVKKDFRAEVTSLRDKIKVQDRKIEARDDRIKQLEDRLNNRRARA